MAGLPESFVDFCEVRLEPLGALGVILKKIRKHSYLNSQSHRTSIGHQSRRTRPFG